MRISKLIITGAFGFSLAGLAQAACQFGIDCDKPPPIPPMRGLPQMGYLKNLPPSVAAAFSYAENKLNGGCAKLGGKMLDWDGPIKHGDQQSHVWRGRYQAIRHIGKKSAVGVCVVRGESLPLVLWVKPTVFGHGYLPGAAIPAVFCQEVQIAPVKCVEAPGVY